MPGRLQGSWAMPIGADQIASTALRLSQTLLDKGRVYWLEGRPSEGGRQVVMCAENAWGSGEYGIREVSPKGVNVRTRVHEYGGGDYLIAGGRTFFVNYEDQRVYAGRGEWGGDWAALSAGGTLHADFALTPDHRWLFAIEEVPRDVGENENRLVAFRLGEDPASGAVAESRVIARGHDFYSFPTVSPDASRIAFTAWNHPDMPWDSTMLYVQPWGDGGPRGDARVVAGGGRESIFQPSFSPDGSLTYISDRSGWWNLYRLCEEGDLPLCTRNEEFAGPQWVFGLSRYAHISAAEILCVHGFGAYGRLGRLEVESGRLRDLKLPYTSFEGLRVEAERACFVGASPDQTPAVVALDLLRGEHRELRRSPLPDSISGVWSPPEAIEFSGPDGRLSHALFYAPKPRGGGSPSDGRPPLLVKSHGGPTAAASAALDLRIQYWLSHGIAVVDVDYGGSTGYGREYRERLRGQWGVVDVADCVAAARSLAEQGRVDRDRLAITGGSAGGYTTLCALTFHDVFRAGASHYGIGDLEALARDTHKFEAHYTDGLVGPYPECSELYRERSPIHFTDRLDCPVIFFQGLEDRIVPPSQAEAMAQALAQRQIPHAYVPFEGEQHGFRKAENIQRAMEGELYFYGRIFGFDPGFSNEVVRIVR